MEKKDRVRVGSQKREAKKCWSHALELALRGDKAQHKSIDVHKKELKTDSFIIMYLTCWAIFGSDRAYLQVVPETTTYSYR